MAIRKVGVLGCGLMGSGIAEVAAKSGFETIVREVTPELLDKGLARIRGSLDKATEKGKQYKLPLAYNAEVDKLSKSETDKFFAATLKK